MKKLNLNIGGIGEMLTREQMKKVVGGDYDGCGTSECSSNTDCKDSRYPKCHLTTCLSTGLAANYCVVA